MNNLPWYLLFIFSAASGGLGSWIIGKFKNKNVNKLKDNELDGDDSNENKKYKHGTFNHKIYFEIGEENEKDVVVDNKDNNRPTTDKSWSKVDREFLSKLVYNQEYDSEEMAKAEVDGDLLIFDDPEKKDPNIKVIQAKEFVTAVTTGQLIKSFIFDPSTKNFYWNFTGEKVELDEAGTIFSKEVVDEIMSETTYNANGWIQPRYLYDVDEKCYYKIECGTRIQL